MWPYVIGFVVLDVLVDIAVIFGFLHLAATAFPHFEIRKISLGRKPKSS